MVTRVCVSFTGAAFLPFASSPAVGHHMKESGYVMSIPTSQVFMHIDQTLP